MPSILARIRAYVNGIREFRSDLTTHYSRVAEIARELRAEIVR